MSTNNAFPFFPLLTLIFVVAKITHYIDWSWWWVLSPMWIGLLVVAVILTLFGLIAMGAKRSVERDRDAYFKAALRSIPSRKS